MPCRYPPSVLQPSKKRRGVISNQHALVGSMGFSRPLLQPEWHQHISVVLGVIPSRPELSGTLGVLDLHSNCSRCLDDTEKLEHVLGVEADLHWLVSVLRFDKLLCFTVFRATRRNLQSVLLERQPHTGHAVIRQ